MIRVAIVEDHAIVRKGLCSFLATEPGIEVAGDAGTGQDALALVREHAPDILLLDIDLPDMTGIDVITRLKNANIKVSIIMLTMFDSLDMASQTMKAGASGYVIKRGDPEELPVAIRKVASGGIYISPQISDRMLMDHFSDEDTKSSASALSNREMQVLIGIARGETISEIARKLILSEGTIKTYKRRINEKLGLRKTADIVKYCIKHGLIEG